MGGIFGGRRRLVLLRFGFARKDVKAGPLFQPGAIARKGPHAVRRAGFQGGNDFEEVAVADEVLDRHGGFEHFAFRHADVQVGTELQALGNDPDQAIGQLRGDVALNFRGKGVDHPLQRLGAIGRMDRGQHQMPGLRRAQGQAHGFRLPHFPHHQHVRVLAQTVQQRLFKTGRVPPHFPLPDEGLARTKGEFNRAFNRHDVPGVAQIDRLDQRGQGGGFAAAGRAADQDQAVGMIDQLFEVGMQVQRFQRRLERRQQTDGKTNPARSLQDVEPAAQPFHRLGHVKGALRRESAASPRGRSGSRAHSSSVSAAHGSPTERKLPRTRMTADNPGSR